MNVRISTVSRGSARLYHLTTLGTNKSTILH